MTLWTKKELITSLGPELLSHNLSDELFIDETVIDSRKADKNKLFIALEGKKHDAHDFLQQIFENDCEVAVIHKKQAFEEFKNTQHNLILVKDSFKALHRLAEFSRNRSKAQIIAITGSVGKTTTKEMLNRAFSTQGKTFATFGNLNNHIGLPLCLCNFPQDCDYGIFEMGMSNLNEIKLLSHLVKPHLALITNVGPAHIENFKNEQEIALAKSEIFIGLTKGGIALINHDDKFFEFKKEQALSYGAFKENILSFGKEAASDYQLINIDIKSCNLSEVKVKTKNKASFSYKISSSHNAIISNSLITVACLDILGNDLKTGISTFQNLENPKGRGNISEIEIDGKKIIIIDDTYNANAVSMKSGLEYAAFLKKSLNKNRVIAALGDMLELGDKSFELHEEVMHNITEFKIDLALLVGEEMSLAAKIINKNICKNFPNSQTASLEIKDLLQDGDILYVKGSRGMKMENIIEKIISKSC